MSTFGGFSEDDIQKLKTEQKSAHTEHAQLPVNVKKVAQIGSKIRRPTAQYKLPNIDGLNDSIDVSLEKCKLSVTTPTENDDAHKQAGAEKTNEQTTGSETNATETNEPTNNKPDQCSNEAGQTARPDILASSDQGFAEMVEKVQSAKLEELQLKQKLMEEQNRKRKEMLSKALADRAKQTEEEVLKLEKIKRELAVLDGQFSQDVGVLRKKIDQASLTYAEAEKQYLRVEKEFLQAKLNLQKEKEKKELLSEHLCALIMHNETRKAQKLVTMMEQLANFGSTGNSESAAGSPVDDIDSSKNGKNSRKKGKNSRKGSLADKNGNTLDDSIDPIVVDGVDERTGKMVEVDLNY